MPPAAPPDQRPWRSLNERRGLPAPAGAAPADAGTTPAGFSRRAFLEAAGFATTLGLAGCRQAAEEPALAPVEQLAGMVPGRNLQYASTCGGCAAACGLLVTTKDGRPLKLEGLPDHPLSRGGLCAVGQALPLGLYDGQRFKQPLGRGQPITWNEADLAILRRLEEIRASGGAVRFVTGSSSSPSLARAIEAFLGTFADGRRVIVDSPSASAILDAHQLTHGARVLPRFRFDRAQVIVSFGADFLGTWISPVEFTAGWKARRAPAADGPGMSYHVQFEPLLSLTGTKADQRHRVLPSDYARILESLLSDVARLESDPDNSSANPLAARLWQARGASLVISDSQDARVQVLVNTLNERLGNYNRTVDITRPSRQRQGSDADLWRLFDELGERQIAALFVAGDDPFHNLPDQDAWRARLAPVSLLVSLAERPDEFSSMAHFVCPDHHVLESFSDAEPVAGLVSIAQPTMAPIHDTRSILESICLWSGRPANALEVIRATMRELYYPGPGRGVAFDEFWDRLLQAGFMEVEPQPAGELAFRQPEPASQTPAAEEQGLTLVLHAKVGMPGGRHAHNAWLQELPDPVSKVTWDNPASISPELARRLGLADGDMVTLTLPPGGPVIELPVCIQPGQHENVLGVALGYGVPGTERFAQAGPRWIGAGTSVGASGLVGVNAAGFAAWRGGNLRYDVAGATLARTGGRRPPAATQEHHALRVPDNVAPSGAAVRDAARETTLSQLADHQNEHPGHHAQANLWPADHPAGQVQWGMVIDLNACTGCSACVIACQVENNIPVVGRDEVLRQREMHWLRIDRYYVGPEEDPRVIHQPMLCQHCGHAPCETVCPVLATSHSTDGLNQQTYNRCVGTRYCANNCPYKVRRFNWFNYPRDDALANLALNPDVTVRMRGIMEKCTFCVQRLREAGIAARARGAQGAPEVQTACQQSCPAQAISFGNLNDPASAAARAAADPRGYKVLEELGVKPMVTYLKVVRHEPGDRHA